MIKKLPIIEIGSVVSLTDSTQIGKNLVNAQNIIPRPLKAFKGPPILRRLWQFGESATIHTTLLTVAHPSGTGLLTSADHTVAVRVYQHGKSVLMLYDMTARKLRGLFYMGDDGSFTGEVSFVAGANAGLPYFDALAYGLDSDARWYGDMSYGELFIQNGVDIPVAAQLGRTKAPGKWRKRGTNEAPAAAVISAIAPESSANVQAFRNNSTALTITASVANFPGASGNLKIQVQITIAGGYSVIASTISGDGVLGIPYIYQITAPTGTTQAQIAAFINSDTNAVPVMTAASTSGATPVANWTLDYLAGGSGSGTSAGLTNEVITVYLRYFDSGHNNCGYEGPSSPISNTLVIDASSNKDILVRVPITQTEVELGRFAAAGSGVRIYKQNGDVDPVWNLMNETPITGSPNGHFFKKDGAGNRIWSINQSSVNWFVNGSAIITSTSGPHQFTVGDIVILSQATSPFAAFTAYYVVSTPTVSTFSLASSPGGGAITAMATNFSIGAHTLIAHGWSDNDILQLDIAPAGLSTGTDYIVRDKTTYNAKLSLTRGGVAIDLTTTASLDGYAHVEAVYFVIGSQTEPGDIMSIDQNRPPTHRYTAMAGNYVWCAGVPTDESRVYSSKAQAFDEVHPEGVNLDDYDTIAKSFGTASDAVSGLFTDKISLHVHYSDGIVIVDPENTSQQHEPPIQAGMVNGACCTTGRGNKILFLSSDRNIYSFNGARYGTRAGESLTNDAIAFIRSFVSTDAMERSPHKCNLLHDTKTQMIFVWMPTDTDTVGFAFDETTGGIYGPFYAPCAPTHACALEGARGVYILGDDNGNLFVWDTADQGDSSNSFYPQTAITLHETATAVPTSHAGYLTKDVSVEGVTKRLWFANESILETGFIDGNTIGGDPGSQINFRGVEFRSVKGSRAYVTLTFISHDGREVSVNYGEIGGKERERPHRVSMPMRTTAARLRISIVSADFANFIMRDLTVLYE